MGWFVYLDTCIDTCRDLYVSLKRRDPKSVLERNHLNLKEQFRHTHVQLAPWLRWPDRGQGCDLSYLSTSLSWGLCHSRIAAVLPPLAGQKERIASTATPPAWTQRRQARLVPEKPSCFLPREDTSGCCRCLFVWQWTDSQPMLRSCGRSWGLL